MPTNNGDLTCKLYVDQSIGSHFDSSGNLPVSKLEAGGNLTMLVTDAGGAVVWSYTITSAQISDITTAVNNLINAIFPLNPTYKLSGGQLYQVLVSSGSPAVPVWSLINGFNIANNTINGYSILNYPADGTKFLTGDVNTTWRTLTTSDIPTLTHSKISDFNSSVNSLISSSYPVAITNISNSGAANGQVLTYNGSGNVWSSASSGTYQLTGQITGGPTNLNSIMTTSIANGTIVDIDVSSNAAIQISKININSNPNFNGNSITGLYGVAGSGSTIYFTSICDFANNNLDTVGTLYCSQIQPVTSAITIGGTVSLTGSLGTNLNCGNYNLNNVNQINVSQVSVTTISRPSGQITVSNPLLFTDSGTSFGGTAYGYLNSSGSTGYQASGSGLYSIKTNNRILCASEIDCYSSRNIKNILDSTKDEKIEKEAVNLFDKIPLFKYDYKDKIKNGDGYTYGVIAEELKNIESSYVKDDEDYIPNIMQQCDLFLVNIKDHKNVYKVEFKNKKENIIIHDEIKFFADDQSLIGKILKHTLDDYLLIVEFTLLIPQSKSYFCYGTKESCPSVSKNKLFELNMVVTQYLIKQNNELIKRIEKLENQVNQLTLSQN